MVDLRDRENTPHSTVNTTLPTGLFKLKGAKKDIYMIKQSKIVNTEFMWYSLKIFTIIYQYIEIYCTVIDYSIVALYDH